MSCPLYRHRLAVPTAAPGVSRGLPPTEGTRLCEEDHEDSERPQGDLPVWWRGPTGGGRGGPPPAEEHGREPGLPLQTAAAAALGAEPRVWRPWRAAVRPGRLPLRSALRQQGDRSRHGGWGHHCEGETYRMVDCIHFQVLLVLQMFRKSICKEDWNSMVFSTSACFCPSLTNRRPCAITSPIGKISKLNLQNIDLLIASLWPLAFFKLFILVVTVVDWREREVPWIWEAFSLGRSMARVLFLSYSHWIKQEQQINTNRIKNAGAIQTESMEAWKPVTETDKGPHL